LLWTEFQSLFFWKSVLNYDLFPDNYLDLEVSILVFLEVGLKYVSQFSI